MTLTIELTPEQIARLERAARERGVGVPEVMNELIEHLPPAAKTARERAEELRALFAQWAEEDAGRTPEEVAAEEAAWETIQKNIEENRLSLPPASLRCGT